MVVQEVYFKQLPIPAMFLTANALQWCSVFPAPKRPEMPVVAAEVELAQALECLSLLKLLSRP